MATKLCSVLFLLRGARTISNFFMLIDRAWNYQHLRREKNCAIHCSHMMKRKAKKQQAAGAVLNPDLRDHPKLIVMTVSGPMSAFAARKARQQQAQDVTAAKTAPEVDSGGEPPSKRLRRSLEGEEMTGTSEERSSPLTTGAQEQVGTLPVETTTRQSTQTIRSHQSSTNAVQQDTGGGPEEEESEDSVDSTNDMNEDDIASIAGDADGYESPADTAAALQNFPLSKIRLNKGNIVYSDESTLCVRIQEKMVRNTLSSFEQLMLTVLESRSAGPLRSLGQTWCCQLDGCKTASFVAAL